MKKKLLIIILFCACFCFAGLKAKAYTIDDYVSTIEEVTSMLDEENGIYEINLIKIEGL